METRKNLNFRLLYADEIDCRIATVKEKGISLLLYKDARVDQNLLDETVGPMNWARSHQLIGDRLYCTVSLRDDTGEWISKQDVGTESYTEKEKGQASDSFKRACFNWGIGRELYSAPFIWIPAASAKIVKGLNGKMACYESFRVKTISYDEKRCINALEITDSHGKLVYKLGDVPPEDDKPPEPPKVEAAHINTLYLELQRTGVGIKNLLKSYGAGDIHDLTINDFKDAMQKLKSRPDKPTPPLTPPPEEEDPSLPWSTPNR